MANPPASSDVQPLIEGYQNIDPRLYDILSKIAGDINELQGVLFPLEAQVNTPTPVEPIPATPANFVFSTTRRNLILDWSPAAHAQFYELRTGNNWNTANFVLRTLSEEARLDPIAVGTTRYLLKSINAEGEYSVNPAVLDVIINPLGNVTVTARVIDNNVLLSWSEPTSTWDIDYYLITRNGAPIGTQRGTFAVYFEAVSGSFTYGIQPVDIAGNIGPLVTITATVTQPADFELTDFRISILSGTKTNAIIFGEPELGWEADDTIGWVSDDTNGWESANTGKLLVCINTSQTFQTHFTSRAWAGPSSQIAAGYPVFIQPTATTAQYQEVINYGTTLSNVIASLQWTLSQLVTTGVVSASSTVEYSTDAISWSSPVAGPNVFLSAPFQYLRLTINFTANNDTALAMFSNFSITLDVKREVDSGQVNALASDVGGTVVLFNKNFKDVDSITVSTDSTEPLEVIYDFVDIPNPLGFTVYVFDRTGNRTSYVVSWKARGIVQN